MSEEKLAKVLIFRPKGAVPFQDADRIEVKEEEISLEEQQKEAFSKLMEKLRADKQAHNNKVLKDYKLKIKRKRKKTDEPNPPTD